MMQHKEKSIIRPRGEEKGYKKHTSRSSISERFSDSSSAPLKKYSDGLLWQWSNLSKLTWPVDPEKHKSLSNSFTISNRLYDEVWYFAWFLSKISSVPVHSDSSDNGGTCSVEL